MPDKKMILSERMPPGRVYDIYEFEGTVPQLYVDGTSRITVGTEVSKIEFTQSSGLERIDGLDVDQRQVSLRLTLPSTSLLEFCASVLEQYATHSTLIDAAREINSKALAEAFKRVRATKI